MRQAAGSMADALYERTILWPLDGDIIPTASCITDLDSSKYMSLEQFAMVLSFIESIDLYFDENANEQMIKWCDNLKRQSATTIESTSVTHDSSCDTDTVWNAGNHLLAKMCEREEHADSNFNIVPDEMTTNAFQGHFELDSNTLFDDITTHISDGQQNTLENIDNYTDGNYFILCQLDSVSQTTSYRECSSLKISDNSPRTSISIVETLTWWYKYFLPHELTFMFYLHHRWSIYDPLRAVNIANEFQKIFGTMHSNEIINGVLAFFHSRPDVQLIPRNMFDYDSCYSNSVFMHLVPFTDICSLCNQQLTASHSHSRQVKVICTQGKVVFGTLFWLECRHLGEHKKAPPYFIFPNFIRTAREHIYTLISLYHSKYVYIGGDYAFSRAVVTTYSSNVVNHVSSWWKTADSLNLEAFNQDLEQVQPLCWKRLAQVLLVYHVLQFNLTMGCLNVKIPMSLNDFDDWIWNNYPKMLSWFIYLWSSHKQLIGPCHEKCSAAVIIDGHQKCRRRVCRYKDVEVNNCVVVPDVSLPHSERITQVVETNSSLHSERESPRKIDESACDEKKINVGIPMMEPTNTDWAAQVSIIRKNNNIIDTRRHKKLKRL
ncbi:unnamed protein product [Rotaria magnacalcarata]|uniref:Uncharacterized protein n=2 Tax=Rotaria magnacalcarata TaxID=392030 RepID=A0A814ISM9_9BILA|nr:unnamed protein product [Rotaria magnacalcarata]